MRSIREVASYGGVNRYGVRFSALDPIRQAKLLLDAFGSHHLHRAKGVGYQTKKARIHVVMQFVHDLRALGFKLSSLENLQQRHIHAICRHWKDAGLSPSTITNRLTHLKWLTIALGKRGFMLSAADYGLEQADVARTYVATSDKSWSANPDQQRKLIVDASAIDPWVAIKFELMGAFGLRLQESILLRPRVSDGGAVLMVEEGTKGGRTRQVAIATPEQRDVLDRAKKMSLLSSKGAMVAPDRTPAQERRRVYYVCQKLGINKNELGITPHGQRHGFANDLYKDLVGIDSPVRGGAVLPNSGLVTEAKQAVSNALGHRRIDITAAYTGKTPRGRRPAAPA